MNFPTPLMRPYSIAVSKPVIWALKRKSEAERGDGPAKPELTPDGLAEYYIRRGLEQDCPGLLDLFKQRESFDRDAVKIAATKVAA